jgi:hypothetical protein
MSPSALKGDMRLAFWPTDLILINGLRSSDFDMTSHSWGQGDKDPRAGAGACRRPRSAHAAAPGFGVGVGFQLRPHPHRPLPFLPVDHPELEAEALTVKCRTLDFEL